MTIATLAVLQYQFVQARLLLERSEYTALAVSLPLGVHGQKSVPGF